MSTQIERAISEMYSQDELHSDLESMVEAYQTYVDHENDPAVLWEVPSNDPVVVVQVMVSLYWEYLRGLYDQTPGLHIPESLRTYFDLLHFVELGIEGTRQLSSYEEPNLPLDVVQGDLYFGVNFEKIDINAIPEGKTVKTRRFSPEGIPMDRRMTDEEAYQYSTKGRILRSS